MFEDRFQKVYSQVEIELAQSFPVINCNCEIMFFYTTAPHDEYSFSVNKIEYVFARDIKTGDIKRVELNEIDKNLIEKCCGEIIRPLVMDDEAYEAEDSYYKYYEDIYELILNGRDIDSQIVNELMRAFDRLIPDGNLKNLYKLLGKQLFELV